MIVLPDALHAALLANGAERPADPVPLLKLFNPLGPATWLATEMDMDGDTLFGLADLGFGSPELGSFSLHEIGAVRLPFGLGIERDRHFEGGFPLSVYAEAARQSGSITESPQALERAAAALRQRRRDDPELPPRGG
ncbi:hypothetical protein J2W22_004539 [Sphingomonas kyeonggiensis]|uniref:DUF2958 domain-containing protein n=1 Tax=Sphingomonas kyeonggiensis TaxID=1268553 RepID=UPI002780CAB4|nr:DUF2958 domain-containing protein [Sphingomonas kyeonggiensis]MDQ0252451.1 hypothetical protein [Sphingomonas kyeonggiensis]